MTQPLPLHSARFRTDSTLVLTPSWDGIPVVDVQSGGLISPLIGMLQRQAAVAIVLALVVFHVGVGWVAYRLFHVFPPAARESFLASSEVQSTLIMGGTWVAGLLLVASLYVLRLIDTHVAKPVAELARMSEAVARGELSIPFTPSNVNSEVGRLSRATSGMIAALRRPATTMRTSSRDTTALSPQITAASESASAAAQQTAATSTALSHETERLDVLALGTQGFARAMDQVAAASEEQSDSIDQIAGAASSLSSAAKRVAQLVGTFKLGDAA